MVPEPPIMVPKKATPTHTHCIHSPQELGGEELEDPSTLLFFATDFGGGGTIRYDTPRKSYPRP